MLKHTALVLFLVTVVSGPVLGGFSGTDVFLPSVASAPGVPPAV